MPVHDLGDQELLEVVRTDRRYPLQAYYFLSDALRFAQQRFKKTGHVSGQELSLAIRDLAIAQFGMLAGTVFKTWGISRTDDFGEMVYNLIDAGLFSRTESDRKEDFHNVYDFAQAFKDDGIFEPVEE